jgi:hypothetical protein
MSLEQRTGIARRSRRGMRTTLSLNAASQVVSRLPETENRGLSRLFRWPENNYR